MRIKLSFIAVFCLSLLWQSIAFAASNIEATVSDNAIFLGDRVTLSIVIDDTDSDFQLDTSLLENDFSVSRPSRSSSSTYINGKSSFKTTWQYSLQAKRIGELIIPSFKMGNLSSEPIHISVKEPSQQATTTNNDAIFMENSIDKQNAYIGQPIILTSKVYISLSTSNLALNLPPSTDATSEVYGEDKNSETIRNGIRYQIITREFKINVTKAGQFTIQSPILSGNTRQSVQVDSWRSRIEEHPINIRGESLSVNIKAKPADFQGNWLVSEDVRLSEDPDITEKSYHVGEPITRSITLQIASIDTDKLPNLDFNYPKNLRFYPDQDELKSGTANNIHYAQRIIRHAIIADQPGKLILPEIKLAWWNSKTDKQEYATLPAQTLTILPAETKVGQPPVTPTPTANLNSSLPSVTEPVTVDHGQLIIWQIISALLLIMLIAMIVYHLYYRRLHPNKQINIKETQTFHNIPAYEKLQQALQQQVPNTSYQALLQYAQYLFPRLKSLSNLSTNMQLNKQDKEKLDTEIQLLENACTNPSLKWDSHKLAALLQKYKQQCETPSNINIMDINPS
jgi:hypothetical protein